MQLYHNYGQFNGTVLVAEGGKIIFKKGYGLANMEWNIPNKPDTKTLHIWICHFHTLPGLYIPQLKIFTYGIRLYTKQN